MCWPVAVGDLMSLQTQVGSQAGDTYTWISQHRHTAPWCCCWGMGTWKKGSSREGAPRRGVHQAPGPRIHPKLQPHSTSIRRTNPAPGTSVLIFAGQGLEHSRLFSAAAASQMEHWLPPLRSPSGGSRANKAGLELKPQEEGAAVCNLMEDAWPQQIMNRPSC